MQDYNRGRSANGEGYDERQGEQRDRRRYPGGERSMQQRGQENERGGYAERSGMHSQQDDNRWQEELESRGQHRSYQGSNSRSRRVGDYSGYEESSYPARRDFGSGEGLGQDREQYWQGESKGSSLEPERRGYRHAREMYGQQRGGALPHTNWNEERGVSRGEERAGGKFRGVGPQGFTRSDERIKELVCERLSDDGDLDASKIIVEVKNGEVTLRGSVDERAMKYHAEELIDDISGVKDVENLIRVKRERDQREKSPQSSQNDTNRSTEH